MSLKEELKLEKGFDIVEHEALLNIYYTANLLKKRADAFFKAFGLTDVQFNVMTLLHYHSGPEGGLSQAQLSDKMLVNRANATSLVDRMEKAEFVTRTAHSKDRRFNIIKLTTKGAKLFTRVEPHYLEQVGQVMSGATESEQKKLMAILEKVRANLRQ
jgi:MarR family transcriptional regulator, 2-MHQ and catechol-resistance regulon repressor